MSEIGCHRAQNYFFWFWVVLGIWIVHQVFDPGIFGDGAERFRNIESLLSGDIRESRYSVIGPIFSAPLYYLDDLGITTNIRRWVSPYNLILFALFLVPLYRILTELFSETAAKNFVLILLCGSMFPNHLRAYYGEVFTALSVGLGVLYLISRRNEWVGWLLIGLGAANTAASIPAVGLFALFLTWRFRSLKYLLLVALPTSLYLLESQLLRGGILESGYAGNQGFQTELPYSGLPGFSYPLVFGVLSLLFSFGKGLMFFAPGLLVSLGGWKAYSALEKDCLSAMFLIIAGLVLVYAQWWSWYGGWFWGPRFLLFASIPASLILAHQLAQRECGGLLAFFVAAIGMFSFWIGFSGGLFGQAGLDICTANDFQLESFCWYLPEYSVLFRPFVEWPQVKSSDLYMSGSYWMLTYIYLFRIRLRDSACALLSGIFRIPAQFGSAG